MKYKNTPMHSLILILFYLFAACSVADDSSVKASTKSKTEKPRSASLELIWETAGFNNPESVIYDKRNNVLYVSNVNGSALEKNAKGYIAKLSLQGKILEKQWITGLHAPKGLAIHGNRLYTADIDTLVEIDIPSAAIIKKYSVVDAVFLNDVTAHANGEVFVSDMMQNRIHRLKNNSFTTWLESPELESPNGLLVNGDNIILVTWGVMGNGFATKIPGHLKSISLSNQSISNIGNKPLGNLDGVESDGQGGFYVTDWMAGKLYQVTVEGNAAVLLDLEQGMADLDVSVEKNLILLPMMNNNKIMAYRVK